MRNPDRRPPLPARLSIAERDFYLQLRRVVDAAGLSCRSLELRTSSTRTDTDRACFYSKSQWARWLNGESPPPRKAVRTLAERLSGEGIDASRLTDQWDKAFAFASKLPDAPAGLTVPRQLPSPVGHFVGREAELAALSSFADQVPVSSGPVVVVLEGTAGVGKTTLAIQAAHAVSDRFPDGQLYVNLRGFDPADGPMPPSEALGGFLTALGVTQASQPQSPDDLAALFRSVLAGKRVLVVIDNARDANQARRILPGSPGSLVLVTSRNQLCALSAVGARPLRVEAFSVAETRELLAWRLGPERVCGELDAVDEIGTLCAGLPLALIVAAAHAEMRAGFSLATVASEFRSRGLDLLETGDPLTTARHVFNWSYQCLSGEAAQVFRLLGLVPAPDVSVPAAASLTAMPFQKVYVALDELARAHLAEEHLPGRFRFHDLLRTYAAELAVSTELEDYRREAAHRVLAHYLYSAMSASAKLRQRLAAPQLAPLPDGVLPVEVTDKEQALAWYNAEIPVLLALTGYADANGFDAYAWQLPCTVSVYLNRSGRHQDWVAAQWVAVSAASRLGDLEALAHSHYLLGYALSSIGDNAAAESNVRQALALFRELGDRGHEAMVLNGLAVMMMEDGRPAEALAVAQDGLRMVKAAGYWWIQATLENTVGELHAQLGQFDTALAHCQRALGLQRESGNRAGAGDALRSLGIICVQRGDLAGAKAHYRQALDAFRDSGAAPHEAEMLTGLGQLLADEGDRDGAKQAWLAAGDIYSRLAHPNADTVKARLAGLV